ncbi:hypothetical protein, partial [Paraburkholderia sp. SIMBA_053]|uniref:hypothetical protein n=1 Tax=Paraburkholderia sp. SIMBA_053 TaxID=3085794 RepID=UPI00397CBD80
LLYFFTVWVGINAYATRHDLRPISASEQPARKEVLITSLFFAVPFAILLERIFVGGYTPQYAASIAVLAGVLLLFFDVSLT